MLEIPSEWQERFCADRMTCASAIIRRSALQKNEDYLASFKPLLELVFRDQESNPNTSYAPNHVGMTAWEMFRNSWYHGQIPGSIETTYWYDVNRCVVGVRDEGSYFTLSDTKLLWESAHKLKKFDGISSRVKKIEKDYGGGHNLGSNLILQSPFLLVDINQGALFAGFEESRINE